ncbi:MAG: HEAT repeat domain-containing protein [Myxococcaceae bacterium]|nr:HEAT repeat domain-containing protein [Myxococcaceae bacterium]
MNAQPLTPGNEEPSVAGVRVRPVWPLALYALLVGSALLALWAQQTPGAPEPVSRFAPWAFLAFAIGFAAYRLALVMAKRYSAFKAFTQVLVAAMFFMLLLLPNLGQPARVEAASVGALLNDADPRVRALAAEVVGYRQATSEAGALVGLLSDGTPAVREAAHAALVRLNGGADLGPEPAPWKERFP